jgi:hypothetical protein
MPKSFKKVSAQAPTHAPLVPDLVPVDEMTSQHRPYGSSGVFLGIQGQVSMPSGVFSQVMLASGHPFHQDKNEEVGEVVMFEDSEDVLGSEDEEDLSSEDEEDLGSEDEKEESVQEVGKKARQWRKWSEDIIPALLEPYLELLRESESLRDVSGARNVEGCKGCQDKQQLEVICVYFESK